MTQRFFKWASRKGVCPTCGCEGVALSNIPLRYRVCWAWQCRTLFTIPGRYAKGKGKV